ncbi:MAG TPA: hypothetical protein VFW00_00620 [Rhodocyclaceae bacterium]|nr:hypothetical protein [Rhodocyclaceae bacterium]
MKTTLFKGVLWSAPVIVLSALAIADAGNTVSDPAFQVAPSDGWASQAGGTAGGSTAAAANIYTVANRAQLVAAIADAGTLPKIIKVQGVIDMSEGTPFANHADQAARAAINLNSNTTLLGNGSTAGIINGYVTVNNVSQVIIRNLKIVNPCDVEPVFDPNDGPTGSWHSQFSGLSVQGSNHVWIDHMNFTDVPQTDDQSPVINGQLKQCHNGALDIASASDYVTVSYNVFEQHNKNNTVGASDTDTGDDGHLTITFSNNIWRDIASRAPRVRFGMVHMFNNYFVGSKTNPVYPNNYSIGAGIGAKILSQNNVFEITGAATCDAVVANPNTASPAGAFKDTGSALNGKALTGCLLSNAVTWTVPYAYSLKPVIVVKANAIGSAGAGKITFPLGDPSGLGPDATGRYADARGFYPDAAGRYPDSRGLYANANGIYPTDAEAGLFDNEFGTARSYSTDGAIDTSSNNPFFHSFGNGRTCASCHAQGEGFSVTPTELQQRFANTNGTDPIFSPNDGSNSPNAPVGTLAEKQAAYSMLLTRGVIRIGMPIPTVTNDIPPKPAEFVLDSVSDPYGYASASELSLFRRPLPSTNLRFLSAVMWDSRETVADHSGNPDPTLCIQSGANPLPCYKPINLDLKNQANNATLGHAQAAQSLSDADQQAIVNFEMKLFTAQHYDKSAGFLASANAKGGTDTLTTVDYYFDIGSVFGDPKTHLPSTTTKLTAMQLFGTWLNAVGTKDQAMIAARQSIARGEKIFNTRTFTMVGVGGTRTTTVTGATCTNCHSTPQVGSLGEPNLFNIGIGDPKFDPARTPDDMPLYTLRNITTGSNAGKILKVRDPGLAMITGKWADVGKFKVPGLRGLAMRPPYFHDGSAQTIEDTTAFYNTRFNMNLTAQEFIDLNAFLKSL